MSKSEIGVIADTIGWHGTPNHRLAEPGSVRTLPVIDNTDPAGSNIRTSVDCYVSGQYVQRNGKILEVQQRYSVFVSYGKQTQMATVRQLQDRIASDFKSRYGNFNVATIYVPNLPIPMAKVFGGVGPGGEQDLQMYGGSRLFRGMTSYEKVRKDVGAEHVKSSTNISSIRKRYLQSWGRK